MTSRTTNPLMNAYGTPPSKTGEVSTNVRKFMWKLLHDTHKCRSYWFKIANLSERGMCIKCTTPETMQHIIFNCEANQCKMVMEHCTCNLCQENIDWPLGLDITTIMSLPLINIRLERGKVCTGATRLIRTIISECTFLMWKLRCKRLLDVDPETPEKQSPHKKQGTKHLK